MKTLGSIFWLIVLTATVFSACESTQPEPATAENGAHSSARTVAFYLSAPSVPPLLATINTPFTTTLPPFRSSFPLMPMSYSLSGLPAGLTFNPSTRVIGGTPTQSGNFVLGYTGTTMIFPITSASTRVTLTVTAPVVTGNFEGYFDQANCNSLTGWIWDRDRPNAHITIEFLAGSSLASATVIGTTVANIFRQDLKDAGKGNGEHVYTFAVPSLLKNGQTHTIWARVQNSSYVLKWSPKMITCNGL